MNVRRKNIPLVNCPFIFNIKPRNNSVVYHELKHGDIRSLVTSDYDHSKLTRIFIHGFMMNGYDDDRVLQLRDGKFLFSFKY